MERKKEIVKLFIIPVIAIAGFFIVCFILSTISLASKQGIPRVMYNGDVYVANCYEKPVTECPDGYKYVGAVTRNKAAKSKLRHDFEGSCCSIGARVFSNPNDDSLIYVYGNGDLGRNPGHFVPFSILD